jgi:DNA-binding MarR family transcriptional regulator
MAPQRKNELGKRKEIQNLEQEVFLGLQRTADALMRDVELLLKPSGLSSTQYNVLRILRGAGENGLPCGEVGQRMITHDPDMTRLLDRLEKRGLIARSRETADRRVVRARITPAALHLLAQIDEPVLELHRAQLSHLGEHKLRLLARLLEVARSRPG